MWVSVARTPDWRGFVMATTAPTPAVDRAYRAAVNASITELGTTLQEALSRTLTAYIANVQDGKTVARWARGEVERFRDDETEQRVRIAYQIVALLRETESQRTIRAWFIHLNPRLDDTMPAEAIREGKLQEALYAAQALIANP
jgi:hypothetical protein